MWVREARLLLVQFSPFLLELNQVQQIVAVELGAAVFVQLEEDPLDPLKVVPVDAACDQHK